jgi:hypothetical protein
VLLSPEGFRRGLDLGNDVETLRPNGAGVETSIPHQAPDSGYHWDKVDEAIADGETTYAYQHSLDGGEWHRDLYALPGHTGSGTITGVTVHYRGIANYSHGARASIRTHNMTYDGTNTGFDASWITQFHTWSNNPYTGAPWTWDEIDALEAGVNIGVAGYTTAQYLVKCTQVYVEVEYTLPKGMPGLNPAAMAQMMGL